VSVNVPKDRAPGGAEASKEGTVGRTIPGVAAKIVDLETGADLGSGKSGMLLVTGPNVMKGYLDRPDLTAEVMRDGWYVTGDIAEIDAEGFIKITGRESRISKIGGEMVPHIGVEEALNALLAANPETVVLAVTAVPDAKKGERLIVLYTALAKSPEQICRELAGMGVSPLWIPSPNSFHQVSEIPILGAGKVDLRKLKEMASARLASP
jgi:acyl-[acyl-carrier-protein]-phospholipid O-acyltransferase/long-chain-fatty-acid--[acyl-carrier-protein] ligase